MFPRNSIFNYFPDLETVTRCFKEQVLYNFSAV